MSISGEEPELVPLAAAPDQPAAVGELASLAETRAEIQELDVDAPRVDQLFVHDRCLGAHDDRVRRDVQRGGG